MLVALVGVGAVVLARLHQAGHRPLHDHQPPPAHQARDRLAEIQETRLERVQNVNYEQSALQRMLQVGDVDFDTAAGDDYNFIFVGVADPAEVVDMVDRATSTASPEGLGDEPAAADRGPAGAA